MFVNVLGCNYVFLSGRIFRCGVAKHKGLTNNTRILYSELRFDDGDSIDAVELLAELIVLVEEGEEALFLLLETH